jgi:ribosomal protein L37AE/L43A
VTEVPKKSLTIDSDTDTISVDLNKTNKCPFCGRLMFKGRIEKGSIETKCQRCKEKVKIRAI